MMTWDEPKRLANLAKHGLDFADAVRFGWSTALVLPARRGRYIAIGILDEEIVAMIIKPLGSEAVSVISLRPASRKERVAYAEKP